MPRTVRGLPIVADSYYRNRGKRLLDLALVLASAPVVVPVTAAVGLCVALGIGWPVFFTQQRPGRDGRIFGMHKFRTMTNARGPDGALLPDEERLTRWGRILRSTSLDELPEWWNVLKGDMSLVGPRPLLVEYLPLYSATQARRHEVRPGITGWAQVNGRNAISWEQKFDYDVWYVDHQGLLLDLRILALTVLKVLSRSGISKPGEATAMPFRGTGQ